MTIFRFALPVAAALALGSPISPGHQIRVFEIQRTYGSDAPVIEGLRLKESWSRGLTDFNDLNGLGLSYNTYVLENGDRIFTRGNFIAQSVATGGSLRNMAASTLTGGTRSRRVRHRRQAIAPLA